MIKLAIAKDSGGSPIYAPAITDSGWVCVLPADTVVSLSVPVGARIAIFGESVASDYWVGSSTFSLPSSSSFVAANILLNPPPLVVTGVSTLYFRAPLQCSISVSFYG